MSSTSREILLAILAVIAAGLGAGAETPAAVEQSERSDEVEEIVVNSQTGGSRGVRIQLDGDDDLGWLNTPALQDPLRSPMEPLFEPVAPPASPTYDFDL